MDFKSIKNLDLNKVYFELEDLRGQRILTDKDIEFLKRVFYAAFNGNIKDSENMLLIEGDTFIRDQFYYVYGVVGESL